MRNLGKYFAFRQIDGTVIVARMQPQQPRNTNVLRLVLQPRPRSGIASRIRAAAPKEATSVLGAMRKLFPCASSYCYSPPQSYAPLSVEFRPDVFRLGRSV